MDRAEFRFLSNKHYMTQNMKKNWASAICTSSHGCGCGNGWGVEWILLKWLSCHVARMWHHIIIFVEKLTPVSDWG